MGWTTFKSAAVAAAMLGGINMLGPRLPMRMNRAITRRCEARAIDRYIPLARPFRSAIGTACSSGTAEARRRPIRILSTSTATGV